MEPVQGSILSWGTQRGKPMEWEQCPGGVKYGGCRESPSRPESSLGVWGGTSYRITSRQAWESCDSHSEQEQNISGPLYMPFPLLRKLFKQPIQLTPTHPSELSVKVTSSGKPSWIPQSFSGSSVTSCHGPLCFLCAYVLSHFSLVSL